MAELERSLIVERVRAGLRNARAKGKTLGRPRKIVDATKIAALRAQGRSWRDIAREVGTSARRAVLGCDKNLSESSVGSLYRSTAD